MGDLICGIVVSESLARPDSAFEMAGYGGWGAFFHSPTPPKDLGGNEKRITRLEGPGGIKPLREY